MSGPSPRETRTPRDPQVIRQHATDFYEQYFNHIGYVGVICTNPSSQILYYVTDFKRQVGNLNLVMQLIM